jgi:hypothetical protein
MENDITKTSTKEIINRINSEFKRTLAPTMEFYFFELNRRQTEQIIECTEKTISYTEIILKLNDEMVNYTNRIKTMTLIILIFTFLNLVIFIFQFLK